MFKKKDLYAQRGVSSSKLGVHEAVKIFDKGLFDDTFCKFLPDVFINNPDYCMLMHGDGAGTKVILPYLYWKATGDPKWFRTIVQDALVMNLDDMAAAGVVDNFMINSTIDRNAFSVPDALLKELMQGTQDFIDTLATYGVTIHHSGGETADVGDVVRTFSCNFTVVARARRDEVVRIAIQPGDHVLGFPSFGACVYDHLDNSGIGANGLTSARHDILSSLYRRNLDCYDVDNVHAKIPMSVMYNGKYLIADPEAELLMHPTRTYLPLLKRMKEEGLMKHVTGIIHNTGGGHAKVLNFLNSHGITIRKNFRTPLPHVFQLIQETRTCAWEEMFRTFNMGVRLEVYAPENIIGELRSLGAELGLDPVMDGEVSRQHVSWERTMVHISHPTISDGPIYIS